ncbi:MAG: hypothetical protein KF777_15705 [Planctomycetaceae bacterium]|nr:hypothetical protein [Planctomycetaceae bacterium]
MPRASKPKRRKPVDSFDARCGRLFKSGWQAIQRKSATVESRRTLMVSHMVREVIDGYDK